MTTLATDRTLVRRLRKLYGDATPRTKAEGRAWYAEARDIAEALSAASPYTVTQCAYTLAALSPNVPWPENVTAATIAVDNHARGLEPDTWKGAGYTLNKRKADRILSGDLDALQGPKVTVFARSILGDPDAVTVDLWMQRAVGHAVDRAPTKSEHRRIDAAIRKAAYACGESPRDFQAIVWTQIRNATLSKAAHHLHRRLATQ